MSFTVLVAAASPEAAGHRAAVLARCERFHICGEVSGCAALRRAAEDAAPDLIVTDAELPDGNALEAVLHLRRLGAAASLVAVCQRPDFALARLAVDCHAESLLLAPVSDEALLQAAQDAADRLSARAASLPRMEYRKVIGRLFLDRGRIATADNLLPPEIVNSLYDTHFRDDAYRMVVVCLDLDSRVSRLELTALLESCMNALYADVAPHCYEIVMRYAFNRVHILLNYAAGDDGQILQLLLRRLRLSREATPLGCKLSFSCSGRHSSIQDVNCMAEESMDAAWSRFTSDAGHLLLESDDQPASPYAEELFRTTEQALKHACYELNLPKFQEELARFCALPERITGRHETRRLLRRVEYYMIDTNHDLISADANVNVVKQSIVRALQSSTSLSEYLQKYSSCLTSLFRQALDQIGGKQSRYVRLVKQYVQSHLGGAIRLTDAAEWVGLSPVYLSALFKKETDSNFSDYVNACRIERAKELLADQRAKVCDIAQSLGFYDARYFSRVFKEIVGMRPTEYRAALRGASRGE
ncbi:MAG: helix-turn-helix domain-containing protein [Oscillospiraceae bacterium]